LLCSSIFLTFASYSLGAQNNLKTSQAHIFNGLYANYTGTGMVASYSSFTYSYDSGTLYNVTWRDQGGGIIASWLEDTQTRLISSSSGAFSNGAHTPLWIFTNVSIGNSTSIAVGDIGDHPYTVTGETLVNYPGFGNINVWILQDDWYATLAWYEKTTGLLINGTFQWFAGFYTLDLTKTNMFSPSGGPGVIPAFEILLVLPLIGIITFLVLWRRRKSLRIDYK
ncbi:MAG: hypothetical protein ACFE9X_15420, partial [Promethearchaeota archaeon]